jgi:hypothetical protein
VSADPLSAVLEGASIGADIGLLRPDYRALMIVGADLMPGPPDATSEAILAQAERAARAALMRRAGQGLPGVDRLTDAYNAISIAYEAPLGGEQLDAYAGSPRLVRANGDELFDTLATARSSRIRGPRRGHLARRHRRDLPQVELAPVRAHPADPHQHTGSVHHRRLGADVRRAPERGRSGAAGCARAS